MNTSINAKLLIIPLLIGISTSSHARIVPSSHGDEQETSITTGTHGQQTANAIKAAIKDAKKNGTNPATAAAQLTKDAINAAVAAAKKNGTDPAAAVAQVTKDAVSAAVAADFKVDEVLTAITSAAFLAAPDYEDSIEKAALDAAPNNKNAINYAIFDNDIKFIDTKMESSRNDIPAVTNIYVQKQSNIQLAVTTGRITPAQGFMLQILLLAEIPANAGISGSQLQKDIIAAATAGTIPASQAYLLQTQLFNSAPTGSGVTKPISPSN